MSLFILLLEERIRTRETILYVISNIERVKMKRKKFGKLLMVMSLLIITLVGCNGSALSSEKDQTAAREENQVVKGETKEDYSVLSIPFDKLNGKKAGVMTGTPQDTIVSNNVENAEIQYYNNYTDLAIALQEGKIDFYVNNTIQYPFVKKEYPDFSYLDGEMASFNNGAIFPKSEQGKMLRDEFNDYLAQIKNSGKLDELKEYWLKPNEWEKIDIPETGEKGTLKMATCTSLKPFSFVLDNGYAGFDVALVAEFCRDCGYALRVDNMDFAGVLSGITAEKYDLAACQIAWTEERDKSVLFSELYVSQVIVPYVRTADYVKDYKQDDEQLTLFQSLARSFRRTFVEEQRWKIILGGIVTTLIISVFGFALANVLGAVFCTMSLSGKKGLKILADIYSRIMQGTPIIAILMILFYIVFGNSNISGIIVAIIGFGITSGAYLAQTFSGAIRGVDKGQTEAALALGMTEWEAFSGIVLPQAIRRMLPGYFSQLISLIKSTSIVGYIAVVDLTKASDIVRSATFEAFFPILTSALIYFLISNLLLSLMKMIQKKLAPKRRKASGKEEK